MLNAPANKERDTAPVEEVSNDASESPSSKKGNNMDVTTNESGDCPSPGTRMAGNQDLTLSSLGISQVNVHPSAPPAPTISVSLTNIPGNVGEGIGASFQGGQNLHPVGSVTGTISGASLASSSSTMPAAPIPFYGPFSQQLPNEQGVIMMLLTIVQALQQQQAVGQQSLDTLTKIVVDKGKENERNFNMAGSQLQENGESIENLKGKVNRLEEVVQQQAKELEVQGHTIKIMGGSNGRNGNESNSSQQKRGLLTMNELDAIESIGTPSISCRFLGFLDSTILLYFRLFLLFSPRQDMLT